MWEEISMKKYIKKICVLLAVLMLVMGAFAVAEIKSSKKYKVSKQLYDDKI